MIPDFTSSHTFLMRKPRASGDDPSTVAGVHAYAK